MSDEPNLAPTPEPPPPAPTPTTTTATAPQTFPPRVWTTFGAFFGAQGLQGVIALPLYVDMFSRLDLKNGMNLDAIKQQMADPNVLAISLLLAASANLLIVLAATWASSQPWRVRLSIPSFAANPLDVVLLLSASLGIGELSTSVAKSLGGYDTSVLKSFETSTTTASTTMLGLLTFCAVFAAVVEELLFRGYIQTRMSLRWGPKVAVVATSAMFGFMHGDLVQGSFAFVFALVVGAVAYKRASIVPGIYAHVINNFIASVAPTVISARFDLTMSGVIGGAMFVVGAALLALRLRNVTPPAGAMSPALWSTQLLQPGAPSGRAVGGVFGGGGCLIGVVALVATVLVTMSVAKRATETPPPAPPPAATPATVPATTPAPPPPTQ